MFGIPAVLSNTDECLGAAGMCCEANMSRSCDTSVLAWRVSRESYIRVRGCEPVLLHGLLFRGQRLQFRFWHFAWTFNQTTQSARCRPPALIRRPVPRTSTYIQDSVSLRCFKKTFCWVNFVVDFQRTLICLVLFKTVKHGPLFSDSYAHGRQREFIVNIFYICELCLEVLMLVVWTHRVKW